MGRKCDGEPGMQALWLGLQRVREFAEGMRFVQALHPLELPADPRPCDFFLR